MGGYSKIKDMSINTDKSPSQPPKDSSPDPKHGPGNTQSEPMKEEEETSKKTPSLEEEEEERENGNGELRRNFSTASHRFMRLDRQSSSSTVTSKALQAALRRAFSVRSSSVSASDRYSRFYNQGPVTLASPDYGHEVEDDDGSENGARSGKKDAKVKRHKSGTIFRACKRIFGL